jgi:mannose-1-phosphate guanylyltransferase
MKGFKKGKIVQKPWGEEFWVSDGSFSTYALKKIFFKSGSQTSLHVHKFKFETNYVLNGTGIIQLSKERWDVDDLISKQIENKIFDELEFILEEYQVIPGSILNVPPGYIHRVRAITDLEFFEVSTEHLDDVYRLIDDTNRGNGKIASEHA